MIRKEFLCVNSGGFLKNSISRFFAKTQNARRPKTTDLRLTPHKSKWPDLLTYDLPYQNKSALTYD